MQVDTTYLSLVGHDHLIKTYVDAFKYPTSTVQISHDSETKIDKTTLTGLEPARDQPSRFLVDRLNHSATVSCTVRDLNPTPVRCWTHAYTS